MKGAAPKSDYGGIVVPLTFLTPDGPLSFLSTTTVFGTPIDITLSELAIESFFPADAATAEALRQLAARPRSGLARPSRRTAGGCPKVVVTGSGRRAAAAHAEAGTACLRRCASRGVKHM